MKRASSKQPAASQAYHSPLRAAQMASTRRQILDAVAVLIERGEEPTYAAIAKAAGVQQRTVFRHFPTTDALHEAFWWDVLDARLGKTGYDASDLPALLRDVEATFQGFDRHPRLVLAMLRSVHGLQIRLRTNDRRVAMFERVARHELPHADVVTVRRAAAISQLLYSGTAWQNLREYWSMDASEAFLAVQQALTAMFEGLRRESASPVTPIRKKTRSTI